MEDIVCDKYALEILLETCTYTHRTSQGELYWHSNVLH